MLSNKQWLVGSEGLEPTTPAVFLMRSSKDSNSQSGVLTKLDDEPLEHLTKKVSSHHGLNAFSERS
jgi:hypothetical protein